MSVIAVEKLRFPQNSENLEDRKCLGQSRTSFIGHPDAILLRRISREGGFQHPRDFLPTTSPDPVLSDHTYVELGRVRNCEQLFGCALFDD
jgi:hypothetical protein